MPDFEPFVSCSFWWEYETGRIAHPLMDLINLKLRSWDEASCTVLVRSGLRTRFIHEAGSWYNLDIRDASRFTIRGIDVIFVEQEEDVAISFKRVFTVKMDKKLATRRRPG